MTWAFVMERVTRIELALSAREAMALARVSGIHRPGAAGGFCRLTDVSGRHVDGQSGC